MSPQISEGDMYPPEIFCVWNSFLCLEHVSSAEIQTKNNIPF